MHSLLVSDGDARRARPEGVVSVAAHVAALGPVLVLAVTPETCPLGPTLP